MARAQLSLIYCLAGQETSRRLKFLVYILTLACITIVLFNDITPSCILLNLSKLCMFL